MNIIEIRGLSHRFSDGTLGLDAIDIEIKEGEFIVIAGRNGSGKTTLLRHLNGLLRPQTGSVKLAGISVSEDFVRARQMVGMVFQDADSQIIGETVYDDVAFGPENLRLERSEVQQRVSMALEAGGLIDLADHRPHLLSGGEKRRLAIAGILAMKPRVIVFDEPFSNLDYPGVKQVLEQILTLHQAGHTILITTHDLEKVLAHADRLVIMQKGKIVRDGLPNKIVTETEAFGVRQPCTSRLGLEIGSWLI
ncbi:MAG: ABC transporter ATP-binding protein [Desulfobacterales bacterium]|nr:ABC transporter ATP-binding protein [Desulfobacterales bacterium]